MSIDFRIRDAVRKDVPEVTALWREMMDFHAVYDARFQFARNAEREVERHLVETIRSRAAHIFVAESQGAVVGYVLGEVHSRRPIYPIGTYGFISDIAVSRSWRRKRIGSALVHAILDWFRRERVTSVELFAAEANPVSVGFWRSLGFQDYLKLMRFEMEGTCR